MSCHTVFYDGPIVTREEATDLGLKHFFTGDPCKHGHISTRYVASKTCATCERDKQKAWSKLNPEKVKERNRFHNHKNSGSPANLNRSREYYRRNKEAIAARAKERRLTDQDYAQKRKEGGRLYRLKNPDKNKAYHKAYSEIPGNKEKLRKKAKEWRLLNSAKVKNARHSRRAREKEAIGSFTSQDIERLLRLQKAKCVTCRASLKAEYHIDHIMPIAKGGTNWPSNLQLLCPPCNRRKHDKLPHVWARENGLLI